MVDNISSVNLSFKPKSQINKSFNNYLTDVVNALPDDLCSKPLVADNEDFNYVFEKHGYFSLYLIAPFERIFPAIKIAAFIHAFSFIGLIFAVYLLLRQKKIPKIFSIIFITMIMSHPAWALSFQGQFYNDRQFLLFGFLFIVFLHEKITINKQSIWPLIIVGILCSLIHERSAGLVGGLTILMLILYRGWPQRWKKKDVIIFIAGLSFLTYSLIYISIFQQNYTTSCFLAMNCDDSLSFWSWLTEAYTIYSLQTQKFILINIALVFFAFFNWRLGLISLIAMMPNILFSIGDAEKTGFVTHYHSFYFPILVASATLGAIKLWNNINKHNKLVFSLPFLSHPSIIQANTMKLVFGGVILLLIIFYTRIQPTSISPIFSFNKGGGEDSALFSIFNSDLLKNKQYLGKLRREIAADIPENSVVSTTESYFPIIHNGSRIIHLYPQGIGNADYVIVDFMKDEKGEFNYKRQAFSHKGEKTVIRLNECLSDRLNKNFKKVKIFPTSADKTVGAVILKPLSLKK